VQEVMITTKIATINDLEIVAALFDAYRQFYKKTSNLSLARNFIRDRMQNNESVIILAVNEDNKTVGFCQLYPTFCSVEVKPIYVLYDLFVAPETRRSGAGKVLLQTAEQLAADNGVARLDLTTAKTNEAAQSAYETLGWVRDEIFYAYSKEIKSPT
jgi:ribosomal protein S18 acetylase RimI-like enzyme